MKMLDAIELDDLEEKGKLYLYIADRQSDRPSHNNDRPCLEKDLRPYPELFVIAWRS